MTLTDPVSASGLSASQTLLDRLRVELATSPQPQPLSNLRYDQAHEAFEQSSNQQQRILQWLLQFVAEHWPNRQQLSVLSVGCGNGMLDCPLIDRLSSSVSDLAYTAVEPNPVACQRFLEAFAQTSHPQVSLRLQQATVEEFSPEGDFDFIHVVHSLYYFPEPAQTLFRLTRLLAPEGLLVVALAPKAELNTLADCFWSRHQENVWFSYQLEAQLQLWKTAYTKIRLEAWVDVDRCFDVDCPQGLMLLDFITQVELGHLHEGIRQLCRDYLRATGSTVQGGWALPHPVDFFILRGPIEKSS